MIYIKNLKIYIVMRSLKLGKNKNMMTRITGTCGILLPATVFMCIGFAIANSPWFSWTHNALSDLGAEGVSAFFFNSGMILGGVLAFVFSLGLMKILSNRTGAYILSLSSLALIGIGVFPETIMTPHFITSAAFFVLLTVSLLIIGLTIKQDKFERNMGGLAILFGIFAISSIILLLPFDGIAIPESLVCFPAFIWCMVYGLKMALYTEPPSSALQD